MCSLCSQLQGHVLPPMRTPLCRLQDSLQVFFIWHYTEKIPYGKNAFLLPSSSLQKLPSYRGCTYGSSIFPSRHLNVISHSVHGICKECLGLLSDSLQHFACPVLHAPAVLLLFELSELHPIPNRTPWMGLCFHVSLCHPKWVVSIKLFTTQTS